MAGTTYADVRTAPHRPTSPPTRGSASSTTQIEVVVAALTGAATGGAAILSYHIEFREAGGSGTWAELQGESSNSLSLSATKAGLETSRAYEVRYRARNIFGWSPQYSDVATISTITVPDPVASADISVSVVGSNVVVSWTAPASNGSPVLSHQVSFATSAAADAAFVEEPSFCSEAQVGVGTSCTIPMSQFWQTTAASPLNMVAGDQIRVKVRAKNAVGYGDFSSVVTSVPSVETVPQTPTLPPVRVEAGTSPS